MSQKGLIGAWRFQEQMLNVGAELVTNGNFSTGDTAGWVNTAGGNITVSGEKAVYSGVTVNTGLYQNIGLASGVTYRVQITISDYVSGDLRIRFGSSQSIAILDANGSYEYDITYSTYTDGLLYLVANVTGNYSVDNISVKTLSISDLTPQGNELSIYGASFTTDRKGRADSALSFDGTDDYLLKSSTLLDPISVNSFAISVWVNHTGIGQQTIVADTTDGSNYIYLHAQEDGNVAWNVTKTGNTQRRQRTSDTPLTAGYHNIVFYKANNDDIILYIDGVLNTSRTNHFSDTSPNTDSDTLQIGRAPNTTDRAYFGGIIDEVRLVDDAANKISDLASFALSEYNTYQPDGALNTGSLQKGLVAHFPLRSEYNKVGDEMVVGGDCSSDSFAKEAGWAYDAGNDEYDGTNVVSNNSITQSIGAITRYRSYATQFEIKNYSSGEMKALVGAYEAGAPYSEDGKHSDIITPVNGSSNTTLYIGGVSSFNGSVDNISLKPLLSADITPQGNHAEVWGGNIDTGGWTGNGTSERLNVPDTTNFEIEGKFTIFGRIKISSVSGASMIYESYEQTGSVAGVQLLLNSSGFLTVVSGRNTGTVANTDYKALSDSDAIDDGEWHDVACSWDETNLNLYVDGVPKTSVAWAYAPSYNTNNKVAIGANNYTGSTIIDYFGGIIDDVRVYNRALSATEVLALHNKGRN